MLKKRPLALDELPETLRFRARFIAPWTQRPRWRPPRQRSRRRRQSQRCRLGPGLRHHGGVRSWGNPATLGRGFSVLSSSSLEAQSSELTNLMLLTSKVFILMPFSVMGMRKKCPGSGMSMVPRPSLLTQSQVLDLRISEDTMTAHLPRTARGAAHLSKAGAGLVQSQARHEGRGRRGRRGRRQRPGEAQAAKTRLEPLSRSGHGLAAADVREKCVSLRRAKG